MAIDISSLPQADQQEDPAAAVLEYVSKAQRDKIDDADFAWPEEKKFPIDSQAHLDASAKLLGHAPADKQAAIKARIKKIAKRKGFTLPDSWQQDGNKKPEATEACESAEPASSLTATATTSSKPRIAHLTVNWLHDGAVSLNGRQYPESAVNQLVQSAQRQLSDPGSKPLTCYVSHGNAEEDDSTKLVGRVTNVWKEGTQAKASIDIPDTRAGRDLASLIQHGYLNTMSLRASGAELSMNKLQGMPQVGGSHLTLDGIDITATPGIPEARIQQCVLESANRPGSLCEVFDLASSPDGHTLLLEEQEAAAYPTTTPKEHSVKEDSIPSTTSGVTVGMTDDPTQDDYAKRLLSYVPPMEQGDVTNGMATDALREAHDHIAAVQNRTCTPDGMESAARAILQEAGRALSGKNDKHLDAAHDNIAKALGLQCAGSMNKQPAKGGFNIADPDGDGDNDNNMEAHANANHKEPAPTTTKKETKKMTPQEAAALLREAGYFVEPPKTAEQLMAERIEEQRRALEAELAEQRKTFEAQMAEMKSLLEKKVASAEPAPQRKSLVEGATMTKQQPEHPRFYQHGDYLKEQIAQLDWNKLADRSAPLPEHINVERLLEEMKTAALALYHDKYGLYQ